MAARAPAQAAAIMAQEDRAQGCPTAKTSSRATVSLAPEETPRM